MVPLRLLLAPAPPPSYYDSPPLASPFSTRKLKLAKMADTLLAEWSEEEIKTQGQDLVFDLTVPTVIRIDTMAVCAAFLEAKYKGLHCLVLGAEGDRWGNLRRHRIPEGTRHLAVFGRASSIGGLWDGSIQSMQP